MPAGPGGSKTMLVKALRTEKEFSVLEKEWNHLLQNSSSNTIFLTWEWMHTWWKYYGHGKSLFIITVRDDDGRLIGLAPLCIKKVSFHGLASLKAITFLGTGEVCSDYLDFITSPDRNEEVLKAVFNYMRSQAKLWDCVILSDLSETSASYETILEGFDSGRADHFISEVKECPYLALPESYESYLQSLSKSTRYNLARRTRVLEAEFKATFSTYDGSDEIGKVMERLFDLHKKRRKMMGEEGNFLQKNMMHFHREVSRILWKTGAMRMYYLMIDRAPVAMLYGFKYNNRFFYYQSGMNPDYEKQSVGMVLMGYCIRDCISHRLEEFDFLRGNEAYKSKWTKTSRKTVNIILGSDSVKGRLFMSAESLLLRAKSVMRKKSRKLN